MLPAGTPMAIVDRLDKETRDVLAKPEIQQQFSSMGADADYLTQDEFARFIGVETSKWTKVAKQAGIQAQ
jgi:tripartite-type tricarboxylate transporter receptor subunit TctC